MLLRRRQAHDEVWLARKDAKIADLEAEVSRALLAAKVARGEAREAIGERERLTRLARAALASECVECRHEDGCACACHRGRTEARRLLAEALAGRRRPATGWQATEWLLRLRRVARVVTAHWKPSDGLEAVRAALSEAGPGRAPLGEPDGGRRGD